MIVCLISLPCTLVFENPRSYYYFGLGRKAYSFLCTVIHFQDIFSPLINKKVLLLRVFKSCTVAAVQSEIQIHTLLFFNFVYFSTLSRTIQHIFSNDPWHINKVILDQYPPWPCNSGIPWWKSLKMAAASLTVLEFPVHRFLFFTYRHTLLTRRNSHSDIH